MEDKWKKMRKEREREYEHGNNWRKMEEASGEVIDAGC